MRVLVAVGPGKWDKNGKRIPLEVKKDDHPCEPEPGSDQAILLIFKGYRSKNRCFLALKLHFQAQNHPYKGQLVLEVHRLHYC